MTESENTNTNQHGFKCAFCSCIFSTKSDLERHMDCFGNSKTEHVESFRKAHGRLEHESFGDQEG